jgi:glyoxylase-like metal-dependent hydrolase (beta-lactamase superfamily II)
LRERRLPRFAYDHAQMHASLDRLAMIEAGGARIFFGHDPEFWKTVPQAPELIVRRWRYCRAPSCSISMPKDNMSYGKSALVGFRPVRRRWMARFIS